MLDVACRLLQSCLRHVHGLSSLQLFNAVLKARVSFEHGSSPGRLCLLGFTGESLRSLFPSFDYYRVSYVSQEVASLTRLNSSLPPFRRVHGSSFLAQVIYSSSPFPRVFGSFFLFFIVIIIVIIFESLFFFENCQKDAVLTMSSPGPDVAQLSDSERSALETYTAVTGQELSQAIPLLRRSQWNVQVCYENSYWN